MQFAGSPLGDWAWGLSMDSAAFHELIAHVRSTTAELAIAEQKVAAFKAELAQQEHGAQLDSALQRAIRPIPKRDSGWLPATDTHVQRDDGLTRRRSNRATTGSAAQNVGAPADARLNP
jgi:hypothetical protein